MFGTNNWKVSNSNKSGCIHVTLYDQERHGASHTHTQKEIISSCFVFVCVCCIKTGKTSGPKPKKRYYTEPDMNDIIFKKNVFGLFKMSAQHLKATAE